MKLNRLCATNEMSHEEWLQTRKQGIGGSDAAAICGLNPFASSISVYIDKTSSTVEERDNEAMRQGRDLEAYVAERFMEATGKKVRRANAIFYNEEHPFLLANVDRLIVGENAGLECKTASAYNADKWEGGKIPAHYEIQCHHYMAVTGADAWYIAVAILGRDFLWRRIERDEDVIRNLVQIEQDFWEQHVLANQMPVPDGSEAADDLIKEYYKESTGCSIELAEEFTEKLRRRDELNEVIGRLEQEKNQIEQEVKVYMADAEKAENGQYNVTWKTVVSNRIDSKTLKAKHPDIYMECCKESSSRRFTIKRVEG